MPKRSRADGEEAPASAASPAQDLLAAVTGLLEADGWPYTQAPGQPVLHIGFRGQNGTWNCYAQALDEQRQFLFYSVCPLNAPAAQLPAVLDFLNRANHSLAIGSFEMNPDTGEIRLRTSLPLGAGPVNVDWLRPILHLNVAVMDLYLPGLVAVVWGNASPAEAIARIEATAAPGQP